MLSTIVLHYFLNGGGPAGQQVTTATLLPFLALSLALEVLESYHPHACLLASMLLCKKTARENCQILMKT